MNARELYLDLLKRTLTDSLYDSVDPATRQGWFRDTLGTAEIRQLAVLRLDGDMYGSTMEALEQLHPRLSAGGYVIVDDYGAVPGCRKAVEDFRARNHITDDVHSVDWTGVFWQRTGNKRLHEAPTPQAINR